MPWAGNIEADVGSRAASMNKFNKNMFFRNHCNNVENAVINKNKYTMIFILYYD